MTPILPQRVLSTLLAALALATILTAQEPPLAIARQGYFFVGAPGVG